MQGREPRRVEKPWGHEIWWAQTPEYAGKILVAEAGHALSLQFDERVLEAGQSWRIEPGTIHSIEALEDSVVFEVSTPHLDDVVRLSDRYGRTSGD